MKKRFLTFLLTLACAMMALFGLASCKSEKESTEGVLYEIAEDGLTASVVGYEGTETDIRIAETYEGAPVTTIQEYAFYDCASLTSVVIPESVKSVGRFAFSGCESLQYAEYENGKYLGNKRNSHYVLIAVEDEKNASYTIHEDTILIAGAAFGFCKSVTNVVVPDGVTSIGDFAFGCCDNLESVTIPDSLTSIGDCAFRHCSSLTSVVIPDGVTSIGGSVFYECGNLTSITLPNSLTSIGAGAFYNCSSLTSVVIPEGVTSIEQVTFRGCTSLTSVVIPDGVTGIINSAFYGCTSLTSVVIPASVTYIGRDAFENCTSLTNVYYRGTEAEWSAIHKENWDDHTGDYTITYNYTKE